MLERDVFDNLNLCHFVSNRSLNTVFSLPYQDCLNPVMALQGVPIATGPLLRTCQL
jgi:hypothetical protein